MCLEEARQGVATAGHLELGLLVEAEARPQARKLPVGEQAEGLAPRVAAEALA